MIRYIITTHRKLDGVALAKPGHWGGKRFSDDEAAEFAAQVDAGKMPFTIERETVRRGKA